MSTGKDKTVIPYVKCQHCGDAVLLENVGRHDLQCESLETKYEMLGVAYAQECANHDKTRTELAELKKAKQLKLKAHKFWSVGRLFAEFVPGKGLVMSEQYGQLPIDDIPKFCNWLQKLDREKQ
jgi:hypothetical protein